MLYWKFGYYVYLGLIFVVVKLLLFFIVIGMIVECMMVKVDDVMIFLLCIVVYDVKKL